jgi:hypothetical protein
MPTKRPAHQSISRTLINQSGDAMVAIELPALGTSDLRTMTSLLADVAPDWTAELHGICVDDASLVVLPDSADDQAGPTYVLSRDSVGYRVDQLHWDRLTEVGHFAGLAAAMGAIQRRVGFCLSVAVPSGATLH